MTQYMIALHHTDDYLPTPDELAHIEQAVPALNDELQAEGAWVFGGGLHPSTTATVVRLEGDQVVTTDGPYAETKEHLGGFWVVEAPDLDAALAIGRRATAACLLPVEVRPFHDEG